MCDCIVVVWSEETSVESLALCCCATMHCTTGAQARHELGNMEDVMGHADCFLVLAIDVHLCSETMVDGQRLEPAHHGDFTNMQVLPL
jgi:hypothetical protein